MTRERRHPLVFEPSRRCDPQLLARIQRATAAIGRELEVKRQRGDHAR